MLKSTLLLIAVCTLYFGIFNIKKINRVPVVFNAVVTLLMVMVYHCVVSGIAGLVGIKITAVGIAILDLVFGGVCIYLCFCRKMHQETYFDRVQLLSMVAYFANMALYFRVWFKDSLRMNFASVDASVQMGYGLKIVTDGTIDYNLYFRAINDAVIMWIIKPFTGWSYPVKAYILGQTLDIILAGMIFWCMLYMIHAEVKWKNVIIFFFTILYTFGYPLYAYQFGWAYFGASIILINLLMIVVPMYFQQEENAVPLLLMINGALYAVFVCYSYFVPVVYFGVFAAVLCNGLVRKGPLVRIAKQELSVFLAPTILGLLYSYQNISELSSGGGITLGGGCYTNMFANFVIFLPLAVCGVIEVVQNKNWTVICLLICSIIFYSVLCIAWYKELASAYYFVKVYNLMWLEYYLLAFYGVRRIKNPVIPIVGILILVGCIELNRLGIPRRMQEKKNDFGVTDPKWLVDVYDMNLGFMIQPGYTDGQWDLYEEADRLDDGNHSVCIVGTEKDVRWIENLAGINGFIWETEDTFESFYNQESYDYIVITNLGYPIVEQEPSFFENLGEICYNNDAGFIIKVTK